MSSVTEVLSNMMYSDNPFVVKKIYEYDDDTNVDNIRKCAINIKYWYASMPEECKSIFHKVIENKTFSIHEGYTQIDLRNITHDIGLSGLYPRYENGPKKAKSYSEALNDKTLLCPDTPDYKKFMLYDDDNNFYFLVTMSKISLANADGSDIVVLNSEPRHALLIYCAIRGVKLIENNIREWEEKQKELELKRQIEETYNVRKKEKA
ncbi:hypothetical protein AAGG91_002932 [Salmonella enterica]